jgi:hypothetical protein
MDPGLRARVQACQGSPEFFLTLSTVFAEGIFARPSGTSGRRRWRQLHDELESRSKARLEEVEARLADCQDRLERVTAAIVERRSWAKQIRRIEHPPTTNGAGRVNCAM